MESFAHRLASGVRVSWASSPSFATVGTVLSTLLVLPLLDILFDVLLGADLSAPNLVRTGYAAALAALTTSVAGGVVGQVVADRNRGVFQEVHMRRRVDAAYWLSLGVVPTLLATTTGAAAIGAVHLLSPVHDAGMLGRVLVLAPVAVTCGLLMGVAAGGIGVDAPDPYLGLTIVSALLPLLTGVIVPLTLCPGWVRSASRLVPMSGALAALDAPSAEVPDLVGCDVLVGALWAVIGLAAARRAVIRLRRGLRRGPV